MNAHRLPGQRFVVISSTRARLRACKSPTHQTQEE